jgi:SM-20-related protein
LNTTLRSDGPSDDGQFGCIASALHDKGYIVLPGVFEASMLNALFVHLHALEDGDFRRAGVGREDDHHVNPFIRKDEVCWLSRQDGPLCAYFDWAEALRLWLNRRLFLGLFDYECHYARYPKGAFYKRHIDAFKGSSNRRLTTVLYLNPDWNKSDGGELLLYPPDELTPLERILPSFGTLVVFLSEVFPHEVLPSNKPRYSLTGWYRINTTSFEAH